MSYLRLAATGLFGCAMMVTACQASSPASVGERDPQVRADLYDCEGCEGVFERDADTLEATARMASEAEPGQRLTIDGTVYRTDGITPAEGVVIYAYQTNAEGRYANGSAETEWSRRHGNLRGWVRTGQSGRYSFETIKPAPYPGQTMPAHIHFTILEPGRQPYWIDDIVFEGEFGVTPAYRAGMTNKGGNGIVPLHSEGDKVFVTRDIILERHPAEGQAS